MSFRWINQEDQALRRFQRNADRICALIFDEGYPWADIVIEIAALRRDAERLFPERAHVFGLVYESRFRRLSEQFRAPDCRGPLEPAA